MNSDETLDQPSDPAPQVGARQLYQGAALRTLVWGYVAYIFGRYGIYYPLKIYGVDYEKHWLAALAVLEGRTVYLGEQLTLGFNYPQWSALVTFWLPWVDIDTGATVWLILSLIMLICCAWIGMRLLRPSGAPAGESLVPAGPLRTQVSLGLEKNWGTVSALLVAIFSPAAACSLFIGQIQPFNAFLAMALCGAIVLRRERLAGVYWAMLCLVKIMPVMLIVPFLFWKKRRIFEGFLAFMAGYFLMLVALGRVGYEWYFVTEVIDKIGFHWRGISMSIPRIIVLYVMPEGWHDDPARYNLVTRVTLGFIAVLFVAFTAAARRRRWSLLRAMELGLLFTPLLSPLFESHHPAWALPVLFLHLRRWVRREMYTWTAFGLSIGWLGLCLEFFKYNFWVTNESWHLFYLGPASLVFLLVVMLAEMLFDRSVPPAPASAEAA